MLLVLPSLILWMAIYPLDSVICPLYNWAQICKLDTFLFTFMRVAKCDIWMIKLKNDVSTTIIWNGYCVLQQLNITGDICIFKYDKAQIFLLSLLALPGGFNCRIAEHFTYVLICCYYQCWLFDHWIIYSQWYALVQLNKSTVV